MTPRAPAVLLCGLLALISTAHADEWETPTTKFVKSDSGRYRAQLEPRQDDRGGTAVLHDDRDPPQPRRLYGRRLVNRVAPVLILLTNNGYLITFDEWHHAGYEHALVIYDRQGRTVMDCSLEQLLLPAEMPDVQQSVSSRWWRAEQHPIWLDKPQSVLNVKTAWGPTLQFDLATGTQTRDGKRVTIPGAAKCRGRR